MRRRTCARPRHARRPYLAPSACADPSKQVLAVPCYQTLPGASIGDASADKTIALVGLSGTGWFGMGAHAFLGFRGSPGMIGFRQIATANARSFYVSGGGGTVSGFLYVPNITTTYAAPIVGQLAGEPGLYDARGVVIYANSLYGTSGDAGYSTVFQIGRAGNLVVNKTR